MATEDKKTHPPRGSVGHRVDCDKIRELLFAYMSRELPDAQVLLVREHLRHCPECEAEAGEIQLTLDFMKRHDPGEAAPSEFSAKRRRRLLWLMEHPFVALCLKHHRITAAAVAVIAVALIVAIVASIRFYQDAVTAFPPVNVITGVPDKENGPLDPVPPPKDGQDGIPGLEPFDPVEDQPEVPPPADPEDLSTDAR